MKKTQTNKQTNKQQQWQRLRKTETFVVWHNDLDSFYVLKVRERVISYYSIPRNAIEGRIAWAHRFDWISHDSKYRTFKLSCNIASASQYNDCLGTRSKASSFRNFRWPFPATLWINFVDFVSGLVNYCKFRSFRKFRNFRNFRKFRWAFPATFWINFVDFVNSLAILL